MRVLKQELNYILTPRRGEQFFVFMRITEALIRCRMKKAMAQLLQLSRAQL